MIALILTVIAVFVILLASEYGWHKGWMTGEFGRKFVHITVGSFVAFWPYFLSWNQIRLLSAAFLVVVAVSTYFNIFRAIGSAQRPTYGEVFFALIVGALTFITNDKDLYTAAILQMSLADGLAAVIGTKLGKNNTYRVFGHTKSVAGTLTFFIVSFLILLVASTVELHLPIALIVLIGVIATGLENIAVRGLDNLLIPLFIGLILAHV